MPDTLVLTLAQAGIFCAGWLIVAVLLREERVAALCWFGYAALEALAIFDGSLGGGTAAAPGPPSLSLSLALLSGAVADIGSDHFVHRRSRYLAFWLAVLAGAIGLQLLAPNLPRPLAWQTLGYDISLLVLLCAPMVLFARPLLAEFGRYGLLALLPLALFTLFALYATLHLALGKGAIEASLRDKAAGSPAALLPVILSSGSFHLSWLALVVGRQVARVRRLARFDALTGLLQRAAFEAEMESALALARRYDQRLSVAFLDVDEFKRINDRGGHRAGDETLKHLGQVLLAAVRASDRLGRWGGEEFVLLMPNTDSVGARRFLERLQAGVRAAGIIVPEGCAPVSLSIGVATWEGDEADGTTLVGRADSAMYVAKSRGGDTTVSHAG